MGMFSIYFGGRRRLFRGDAKICAKSGMGDNVGVNMAVEYDFVQNLEVHRFCEKFI